MAYFALSIVSLSGNNFIFISTNTITPSQNREIGRNFYIWVEMHVSINREIVIVKRYAGFISEPWFLNILLVFKIML